MMTDAAPRLRLTAVTSLILLIFTLLAAPYLTQSLQLDEASSIWFTRLPWRTFLANFCDPHPPGYYLLLKSWLALGTQAFWSRLLSLWSLLLALALTVHLGQAWQNARTGLLAAALLACQPLTIWYAVQTRMYALVLFLGLLTVYLAWQLWHTNGRSHARWFLYWLTTSALLWADFTGLLVWGLLQLIWLVAGKPCWRRWLVVQTAVLLPYLILIALLPASQTLAHSYQPVFVAVQALKMGIYLPPEQAAVLLRIVLIGIVLASLLIALLGPRVYRRWPAQTRTLLTLLLVGGWLLLLLFAAIPRLYTVKRLLVPLLPALALAVAAITIHWPLRRSLTLLLPGLLVCLLFLPRHPGEAWQTAVPQITKNAPQGAHFWVDDLIVPAFAYYVEPEFADQWSVLNGRSLPQLPQTEPQDGSPLFLVSANAPYRDLVPLLPTSFHQRYQLAATHSWPGVLIYEFQPSPTTNQKPIIIPEPSPSTHWGLLLPSPLATCH